MIVSKYGITNDKHIRIMAKVKRPKWLLAIIILLVLLLVWITIFPEGKIAAANNALDEFVLGLFGK